MYVYIFISLDRFYFATPYESIRDSPLKLMDHWHKSAQKNSKKSSKPIYFGRPAWKDYHRAWSRTYWVCNSEWVPYSMCHDGPRNVLCKDGSGQTGCISCPADTTTLGVGSLLAGPSFFGSNPGRIFPTLSFLECDGWVLLTF